jgi:hypothetical protein
LTNFKHSIISSELSAMIWSDNMEEWNFSDWIYDPF